MPVLQIQHVHSFSSEDSDHPTTNILSLNPSKTWRCREPGEKSAYVTVQLDKASLITGIDIGNDHSAFIEVAVGRTGNGNKFEVLLPTSSLMTPMESRNSSTCSRVRMFMAEHFMSETRNQKWDQIKFICTQPFNTHITYGLAFVKIQGSNEPNENKPAEENKIKNCEKMIGRFRFREDSPEDVTLSTGSLFARRKELMQSELQSLKPAAAIREASNIINHKLSSNRILSKQSVSSPNTYKTKVNNENSKRTNVIEPTKINRNRDELLYNSEDMQSNERLEKLLQRDKSKKELQKHQSSESTASSSKRVKVDKTLPIKNINNNKGPDKNNLNSSNSLLSNGRKNIEKNVNKESEKKISSSFSSYNEQKRHSCNNKEPQIIKKTPDLKITHKQKDRNHPLDNQEIESYKPFNNLFKGVIFVLSGFQNPLRADLRKMALDMGASYQSDWNTRCTHLICAFPNTPKYQQVLGKGKIIKKSWIEDCHTQRKYIPWRRYSLVPSDALKDESDKEIFDVSYLPASSNSIGSILVDEKTNSENSDSDEEIRRVKEEIALKNRIKAEELDPFEMSTEIEDDAKSSKLNFYTGKRFYLDESVGAVAAIKLRRYILMFGGTISENFNSDIDYNITQNNNASQGVPNVQPEWIYECNDMEMLLPITRYLL